MKSRIEELVHHYYWDLDINCARTTLSILGELFHTSLDKQTIQSAIGLHGAGGYRAQCGLVEGSLMFFGIYFSQRGKSDEQIAQICYQFADEFTHAFSSLRCYDLRPNGFTENEPPHACENLTIDAIYFTYEFIKNQNDLHIISVREFPEYKDRMIEYFHRRWGNKENLMVYQDCITQCIDTTEPLPNWYLLMDGERIAGGAGLITNDFISRMELYPWVCAIYIEEEYRGHAYGSLLLDQAKIDAKKGGFHHLYLCTDHVGYYEHYGFYYVGMGYHPWGDQSRVYAIEL
jgi:C_GCAxxG_C_C family probable redox protein